MNKNHLLDDKYGFKSSFIRMAKCAKISKPLWATYFELLKKKELEIKNKISRIDQNSSKVINNRVWVVLIMNL